MRDLISRLGGIIRQKLCIAKEAESRKEKLITVYEITKTDIEEHKDYAILSDQGILYSVEFFEFPGHGYYHTELTKLNNLLFSKFSNHWLNLDEEPKELMNRSKRLVQEALGETEHAIRKWANRDYHWLSKFDITIKSSEGLLCLNKLDPTRYFVHRIDAVNEFNDNLLTKFKE